MHPFIAAFLRKPAFAAGARVNRFVRGQIDRIDGHVVVQRQHEVLVEWPRNGVCWEQAHHLCQQG